MLPAEAYQFLFAPLFRVSNPEFESKVKRDPAGKFAKKPGTGATASDEHSSIAAEHSKVNDELQKLLSDILSNWSPQASAVKSASNKMQAIASLAATGDLNGLLQLKLAQQTNTYHKGVAKFYDAAVKALQALQTQKIDKAIEQEPNPISVTDLKKIGGALGGGSDGGVFLMPDGTKLYVKFPKSEKHALNELLAARLYKLAGQPIFEYVDVRGKNGEQYIATKWQDGLEGITEANKHHAYGGFAADAWLANWDTLGPSKQNTLWNAATGEMIKADPGGALLYSGFGTPKGGKFGETASEWDSMRVQGMGAGKMFHEMTAADLISSVNSMDHVQPDDVTKLVTQFGPGTEAERLDLANKLNARLLDLRARRDSLLAAQKALELESEAEAGVPEAMPLIDPDGDDAYLNGGPIDQKAVEPGVKEVEKITSGGNSIGLVITSTDSSGATAYYAALNAGPEPATKHATLQEAYAALEKAHGAPIDQKAVEPGVPPSEPLTGTDLVKIATKSGDKWEVHAGGQAVGAISGSEANGYHAYKLGGSFVYKYPTLQEAHAAIEKAHITGDKLEPPQPAAHAPAPASSFTLAYHSPTADSSQLEGYKTDLVKIATKSGDKWEVHAGGQAVGAISGSEANGYHAYKLGGSFVYKYPTLQEAHAAIEKAHITGDKLEPPQPAAHAPAPASSFTLAYHSPTADSSQLEGYKTASVIVNGYDVGTVLSSKKAGYIEQDYDNPPQSIVGHSTMEEAAAALIAKKNGQPHKTGYVITDAAHGGLAYPDTASNIHVNGRHVATIDENYKIKAPNLGFSFQSSKQEMFSHLKQVADAQHSLDQKGYYVKRSDWGAMGMEVLPFNPAEKHHIAGVVAGPNGELGSVLQHGGKWVAIHNDFKGDFGTTKHFDTAQEALDSTFGGQAAAPIKANYGKSATAPAPAAPAPDVNANYGKSATAPLPSVPDKTVHAFLNSPHLKSYGVKYNAIKSALENGDIAALHAIKTTSTNSYHKALTAYKQASIAYLGGGHPAPTSSQSSGGDTLPELQKSKKPNAAKIGAYIIVGETAKIQPKHTADDVSKGTYSRPGMIAAYEKDNRAKVKKAESEQAARLTAHMGSVNLPHTLYDFTSSGYHSLNYQLRNGNLTSAAPKHKAMQAEFKNVHIELPEGMVIHRGLNMSGSAHQLDTLTPGTVLQDPQWVSTRWTPNGYKGHSAVQLHIEISHGVKGVLAGKWSASPTEREIILPPDTRYVVHSVTQAGNQYHVHVTALPSLWP